VHQLAPLCVIIASVQSADMVKDIKRGRKRKLNRKTECIARPKFWRRKRHHRRAVFMGMKDKKGRVYVKTPGGLRRGDLMRNKRGRIVGKRQHAWGQKSFKNIKRYADARMAKIRELGATGFVKAKENGTEVEMQVYQAMAAARMQDAASRMARVSANLANLQAARLAAPAVAAAAPAAAEAEADADAAAAPAPAPAVVALRPLPGGFAPGDEVQLFGLVSMLQLNGQIGIVLSYGEQEESRYAIRLRPVRGEEAKHVHVKVQNIRATRDELFVAAH